MWKRFAAIVRCPICRGPLELTAFDEHPADLDPHWFQEAEQRQVAGAEFATVVEEGVFLCHACKTHFPIVRGLPIMLPYTTDHHREFAARWSAFSGHIGGGFQFAEATPAPGESDVRRSFSTEWLEYDYDGVIWELNYDDHEVRFEKEVGEVPGNARWFLEVGCGLGLATAVARKRLGLDCVGMDLSLAVTKAAIEFRGNPFMHFVQASAFNPPFPDDHFDVIYSRGVLHHTYSTRIAFARIARLCRSRGTFFLWLYGPGSIWSTPLRWLLFGLEALFRPIISRSPTGPFAHGFLRVAAVGYVAFNRIRRWGNSAIQPLTFRRALHAARDRFTPRYAHRHEAAEIVSWFGEHGFTNPVVLDWRVMPPADQDDFRRNVGVRAVRAG